MHNFRRYLLPTTMFLLLGLNALAQSAEDVLVRTRAVYHALKMYSDTGEVSSVYNAGAAAVTTRGSFQTSYDAPRHFRLKFTKASGEQMVLWTKDQEPTVYSWWSATHVLDSNSTAIPFLIAASPTMGTSTLVTTLLFPQARLNGQIDQLTSPKLEGNETIEGHACYNIVGQEVATKGTMVRPLRLWIDRDSLLVRRIVEGTPPNSGAQVFTNTWNIHPQANPKLTDSDFGFTPPK